MLRLNKRSLEKFEKAGLDPPAFLLGKTMQGGKTTEKADSEDESDSEDKSDDSDE